MAMIMVMVIGGGGGEISNRVVDYLVGKPVGNST